MPWLAYSKNSANWRIINKLLQTGALKYFAKKEIPANRFNDAGFICIFMPKKLLSYFVVLQQYNQAIFFNLTALRRMILYNVL